MGRKKRSPVDPGESRASVAVTVVWMLSTFTTLLCDVLVIVARLIFGRDPGAERTLLFADWMLAAGAIVGALSLLLLPMVYRLRRVLPPTEIAVFSACAAGAPIVAILLRTVR